MILAQAKFVSLYTPQAYELCQKLEFKNMLSRFSVDAPANEAIEKGFVLVTDLGEAEIYWNGRRVRSAWPLS